MHGIELYLFPFPDPRMISNPLSTVKKIDPIRVAFDQYGMMGVGNRNRVIVGFVSHQGLPVHLAGGLITGVKRGRGQIHHCVKIACETLPYALAVTAQDI